VTVPFCEESFKEAKKNSLLEERDETGDGFPREA
jgi:hypothetical protein